MALWMQLSLMALHYVDTQVRLALRGRADIKSKNIRKSPSVVADPEVHLSLAVVHATSIPAQDLQDPQDQLTWKAWKFQQLLRLTPRQTRRCHRPQVRRQR